MCLVKGCEQTDHITLLEDVEFLYLVKEYKEVEERSGLTSLRISWEEAVSQECEDQ